MHPALLLPFLTFLFRWLAVVHVVLIAEALGMGDAGQQ
jgi:hypothetical protein